MNQLHRTKRLTLFLIVSILLGACGAHPKASNTQAFVPVSANGASELDFRLSRTAVAHRVWRRQIEGGRYDFDRYDHEIVFTPMTRDDFLKLKQIYSGFSLVKSEVEYVAGLNYKLSDFLPPLVRALLGWHFTEETQAVTVDGQSLSANTVVNCWGATYEVLREAQLPAGNFSAFYAHDDVMQRFLRDSRYSEVVKSYSKSASLFASPAERNRGLKPGDLLIVGDAWLYHVAIFIDDDLFFEKSGSGSRTMFRLVTYDLLAKTWNPEIYGWSYRRFAGESLPEPMSLFGIRPVFGRDTRMLRIPEALAADLSAVRDQTPERLRDTYFLRKRYRVTTAGTLVGGD